MATKNLVPRGDSEGKLGLSTRKWLEVNAVSGSFPTVMTNNLVNIDGQQLFVEGPGITILFDEANNQYTLSSDSNNSGESDRIFEGDEGLQTSVETINTTDPVANKISFSISGDEKWFIDSDGHMLPKFSQTLNTSYNLGNIENRVNKIFVEDDGLNFKTTGVGRIQTNLNINEKQRIKFGVYNSETNSFDYNTILTAKENVRVATTLPLIEHLVQDNSNVDILNYTDETLSTKRTSITIDDILLEENDRVLVKDHTLTSKNGIYLVKGVGTGITLERIPTLLASNASDFSNLKVTVLEGTENSQQIYFTVPDVNNTTSVVGSTTGVHPMKWLKISGGGGLEAVFDDKAPVLGGDLNLSTYRIFSGDNIRLATNSDGNDNGGIEIFDTSASMHALQINSSKHANTESALRFVANGSYNLDIVGKTISGSDSDYPLVGNVKFYFAPLPEEYEGASPHSNAIIATRNWVNDWVNDQGFLSSSVTYATEDFVTGQGYITSADLTGYIQTNDSATLTSLTLTNITPTDNAHAASKAYVDGIAQGLSIIASVRARQASELTNGTYDGTTQTITLTGLTTLQVDGVDLSNDDRILYNREETHEENGVYVVSGIGSGVVLTRSSDFDNGDNAASKFVFVGEGTSYGDKGYVCTNSSGLDVVGTHSITFTQFSAAGQVDAGVALKFNDTNANTLDVLYDGITIGLDNSTPNNKLEVKNVPVDKLVLGGPNSDVKISSNLLPDITATSVDENNFVIDDITTELSALAADDKFVVWDASVTGSDSPVAKITAGNINQFIRADLTNITGDISLTYTSGTGALASAINKEAITERDELTTLANDDQLLIHSDNDDALKRVKYSTIKSSIETALDTGLDIHGLPKIPDGDVNKFDELAIFNMPEKDEVDSVLSPVRVTNHGLDNVATDGSYSPQLSVGQEIDGVTLEAGDRVLVSNSGSGNIPRIASGIWIVPTQGSAATRAEDQVVPGEDDPGIKYFVEVLEGDSNSNTKYIVNTQYNTPDYPTMSDVSSYSSADFVNKKITLEQLSNHVSKNVSEVIVKNNSESFIPESTKHYLLLSSATSALPAEYTLDFSSGSYSEGDTVSISVVNRRVSNSDLLDTLRNSNIIVKIKLTQDEEYTLNSKDLNKTVTFWYNTFSDDPDNKRWKTTDLSLSNYKLYRAVASDDTNVSFSSINNDKGLWLSTPNVRLHYASGVEINLPSQADIISLSISSGFTKTYYVTHSTLKDILFISDAILAKDSGQNSNFEYINEYKIEDLNNLNEIQKITVTLLKANDGGYGWFIEQTSASIATGSSGNSLPQGGANTVLNYTGGDTQTLQSTLLTGANIEKDTITGGTFTQSGTTFTTADSNIRRRTITGGTNGNIALHTIAYNNLKYADRNTVAGYLRGESEGYDSAGFPTYDVPATGVINNIDVLKGKYQPDPTDSPEITKSILHSSIAYNENQLVTSKTIIEYIDSKIGEISTGPSLSGENALYWITSSSDPALFDTGQVAIVSGRETSLPDDNTPVYGSLQLRGQDFITNVQLKVARFENQLINIPSGVRRVQHRSRSEQNLNGELFQNNSLNKRNYRKLMEPIFQNGVVELEGDEGSLNINTILNQAAWNSYAPSNTVSLRGYSRIILPSAEEHFNAYGDKTLVIHVGDEAYRSDFKTNKGIAILPHPDDISPPEASDPQVDGATEVITSIGLNGNEAGLTSEANFWVGDEINKIYIKLHLVRNFRTFVPEGTDATYTSTAKLAVHTTSNLAYVWDIFSI